MPYSFRRPDPLALGALTAEPAATATRDLWMSGAVAMDGIGERLCDVARDEIIDELGLVAAAFDIRTASF